MNADTALPILSEIYLSSMLTTGLDQQAQLTVVLNLLVVLDRLFHGSRVSQTFKLSCPLHLCGHAETTHKR